ALRLALGLLASGDRHQRLEYLMAHVRYRHAVQNHARINVHVLFHTLIERGVRRDLEDGRRLEAQAGTAPGREGDQVTAARRQPCDGDGVVAGRVHEREALLVYALRVSIDLDQRHRAAFGDRAERFFVDGRQAALFVARGGIGVYRRAPETRVPLPPTHQSHQLLADFAGDGAA